MAKAPTVQDFFKKFPNDETCLEHLMMLRFGNPLYCPKCGAEGQFAKLKKLPAYACPTCGHHIHPMQGTPFERSHTPLQKWFYAMYLFTTSRHGVPAKELQRQLGVTYKTAWRMGHEIRKYMGYVDGDPPLSGHVEIDEMYVGGKRRGKRGRGAAGKSIVFGMVERGGDVITRVVPNARSKTLYPHIIGGVETGSIISTDEWVAYKSLPKIGYRHGVVDHSRDQWVNGEVHTNTIEGLWAMLKRSIRGTHIHVSRKHLPKYLGEFEYRWNMRHAPETMFARLLMNF
jgi:transposase-like protein